MIAIVGVFNVLKFFNFVVTETFEIYKNIHIYVLCYGNCTEIVIEPVSEKTEMCIRDRC